MQEYGWLTPDGPNLNSIDFKIIFKLLIIKLFVPAEILNPRATWSDKAAYDAKANSLASAFLKNFDQYASGSSAEILAAAPKVEVVA